MQLWITQTHWVLIVFGVTFIHASCKQCLVWAFKDRTLARYLVDYKLSYCANIQRFHIKLCTPTQLAVVKARMV